MPSVHTPTQDTVTTESRPSRMETLAQRTRTLWPGVLLAVAIGVVSTLLGDVLPRLGAVTLAILLGILIGNLLPSLARVEAGTRFAEKRVLPLAIVFLGVELQLVTLLQLGLPAVVVIAASVATSLGLSLYLGPMFGFSREFSVLMGAGNGICGSSAVAAVSSAINAREDDTGISISVVNLLGTLGIFALPALAQFIHFADVNSGLLVGGTLQAVGQVVAAGYSLGDGVGQVAVVVKMGRILLLGPIVILVYTLFTQQQATASPSQTRVRVPLFIVGFFVLSILASTPLLPAPAIDTLKTAGKLLLVVAMAGVGLRIQLRTLFQHGPKALLFGGVVAAAQIAVTVAVIFLVL